MTIRRGQPWGRRVPVPADVPVLVDDAALAAWFATASDTERRRGAAVASGDLARTLGATSPAAPGREATEAPVDLLSVTVIDHDGEHTCIAAAHVAVRHGRHARRWWPRRGRLLLAMNAQYIDRLDPTPRSHPNDGRVDVLDLDAGVGLRERRRIRRRMATGSHLPHPAMNVSAATATESRIETAHTVFVDGRVWHTGRSAAVLRIVVLPDATVVYC